MTSVNHSLSPGPCSKGWTSNAVLQGLMVHDWSPDCCGLFSGEVHLPSARQKEVMSWNKEMGNTSWRRKHPNKLPGEVLVHHLGHFKLDWIMHWKASWILGGCALNGKDEEYSTVLFDWVSSMTCSPNSSWFTSSPGLSSTCSTGQLLEKINMFTIHSYINHPHLPG